MSERDVEIVRAAIAAFDRGDGDAGSRLVAAEALMTAPEGWPEAGPWRGREAVLGQFARLAEDWETHTMAIVAAEPVGDAVVAELHWTMRGSASSLAGEMRLFGAYWVRDGQVVRMSFFWDRDQALDAASGRR